VRLNLDAGNVFLAIDNAVPCGLIVNELISNSLKHAFVDGREGEIRVKLQQAADHSVTLLVGDNGVGFPEDIDFSTTGSLGMKLVDMLVQQLDGSLEIRSNDGAEFEISFPGV
jgi:two-component sensor histidine kinase